MKLVSMAREREEMSAAPQPPGAAEAGEPYYPYGICLNLDEEAIEALGIEGLPSAGKQFHIEAVGIITQSSTSDPDADGDIDSVNLTLQITHMGLEHEAEEKDTEGRANRLYGPKEG